MGHKVNPNGYRYGINKNWESRWIAKNDQQMAKWLIEDEKIRFYISKQFKNAQIVRIEIERTEKALNLFINCGQPGVIIGKSNSETKVPEEAPANAGATAPVLAKPANNLELITKEVKKIAGRKLRVNIQAIPYANVAWSAKIIAREIADAIENRVSFRSAQKMGIKKVMAAHAIGVRTHVSGRLGGVEMAREEGYSEGIIPLTTLRADLDYALEEAHTTYGKIGVKVWINRGEIFGKGLNNQVIPKKPEFKPRNEQGTKKSSSKRTEGATTEMSTKSTVVSVGE